MLFNFFLTWRAGHVALAENLSPCFDPLFSPPLSSSCCTFWILSQKSFLPRQMSRWHSKTRFIQTKLLKKNNLIKVFCVSLFTITSELVNMNPLPVEADCLHCLVADALRCLPIYTCGVFSSLLTYSLIRVAGAYSIPCLQTNPPPPTPPRLGNSIWTQSDVQPCSLEGCWAQLPTVIPPKICGHSSGTSQSAKVLHSHIATFRDNYSPRYLQGKVY